MYVVCSSKQLQKYTHTERHKIVCDNLMWAYIVDAVSNMTIPFRMAFQSGSLTFMMNFYAILYYTTYAQ